MGSHLGFICTKGISIGSLYSSGREANFYFSCLLPNRCSPPKQIWQPPRTKLGTFETKIARAPDISHGRGPTKFRYFREIPWNSQKNAKYREIGRKYFQIHVGKTYLILILAIRPVLFTPNVQIYLETSSLQRVNNVPKLPGIFRWTLRKTGH